MIRPDSATELTLSASETPSQADRPEVLEIAGLEVRYGDVVAVQSLDLTVREGELVTLLGPSGCGKTTTLRCIAGLESPSRGEIRIGGELVAKREWQVPPDRRDINMVFQTYAVWPHMTVAANVAFGLKGTGSRAEIKDRAEEALRMVGLERFGSRYGTELSGGQQQRVALARAIVTEPRILLYDEPLSNLDATLREQMRTELRELHDRIGKTAIYVTHDQTEAMVMSDRVVLMSKGDIQQQGTPRELYETPTTEFAARFLGTANLWRGHLRSASRDGMGIVELDGDALTCSIAVPEEATVGGTGTLALRAESIVLESATAGSAPGDAIWDGRVARASYLGSKFEYRVDVGERSVRADGPGRAPIATGSNVRLAIAPGSAVWIPDDEV